MPHGLDLERAKSLLRDRNEVWVLRLKQRDGVSQRPFRMVATSGHNAVCVDQGGRSRFRVPLDKLETTHAPRPFEPKHKVAKLVSKIAESIATSADAVAVLPDPIEAKPPQPPEHNPRERAVVNANAPRVMFDPASRKFYTRTHRWSPFIENARQYPPIVAARARGRLTSKNGRRPGAVLDLLTIAQAEAELARPKTAPPPPEVKPEPVVAPPAATSPAEPLAPRASRFMVRDLGDIAAALEPVAAAMRNEARARAALLAARGARIEAEVELRIARMRADLAP